MCTVIQRTVLPQVVSRIKLPISPPALRTHSSVLTIPHGSKSVHLGEALSIDSAKSLKSSTDGPYLQFSNVVPRIPDWKARVGKSMTIHPKFVTEEEEESILLEIEPYLSRLHYENSHWDDAIHDYRETERKTWNKKNTVIIDRIRNIAFPPTVPQLQLVHVLDLAKTGVIKPHIDSVRFCGNTIAGLSLLSDSVMRLVHHVEKDHFVDIYLPRLSLYVMRFEFTHEILGQKDSFYRGRAVPRDRRISIMCRNEPEVELEGPLFKTQEIDLDDQPNSKG